MINISEAARRTTGAHLAMKAGQGATKETAAGTSEVIVRMGIRTGNGAVMAMMMDMAGQTIDDVSTAAPATNDARAWEEAEAGRGLMKSIVENDIAIHKRTVGIHIIMTATATMMARECRLQAHISLILWDDFYMFACSNLKVGDSSGALSSQGAVP